MDEALKKIAEACLVYGEDYYSTLNHERSVELIVEALRLAECGGYNRAKAEAISKLTEFSPVYVEGGRVPEDAIEHRNQPLTRREGYTLTMSRGTVYAKEWPLTVVLPSGKKVVVKPGESFTVPTEETENQPRAKE